MPPLLLHHTASHEKERTYMDSLNFFDIDPAYIEYLQSAERSTRGFTRVPNILYDNGKKKFFCGIVLELNGCHYFAALTSYKKQCDDNFIIHDRRGRPVSSLRFNYMIPVSKEVLTVKSIDQEPDPRYKVLLAQELLYCKKNEATIRLLAARTYRRVIIGGAPELVNSSCAFLLLERCCKDYAALLAHEKIVPDAPALSRPSIREQLAAYEAAQRKVLKDTKGKQLSQPQKII